MTQQCGQCAAVCKGGDIIMFQDDIARRPGLSAVILGLRGRV